MPELPKQIHYKELLKRIDIEGLPSTSYILDSRASKELLFVPGRRLLGEARKEKVREVTRIFVRQIAAKLKRFRPDKISTLVILSEGIGFDLGGALSEVLGGETFAGENIIGIRRKSKRDKKLPHEPYLPFVAETSYTSMNAKSEVVVSADSVATGATLKETLDILCRHFTPKHLFFLTPAGSKEGCQLLWQECQARNIKLDLVFCEAIFGLGEDGTALPWIHKDTISSRRNLEIARAVFDNTPFCSVGDCGANLFAPRMAQEELWAEEERLGKKLPSFASLEEVSAILNR